MISIPRNRHVTVDQRGQVALFWSDLSDEEVDNGVTCPARTVVDCARRLQFGEALAVADSALRSGQVTRAQLRVTAATSPRTGRRAAARVAQAADARAANPFESMLRAIAFAVPGLSVQPQVHVGGASFIGAPDLVDVRAGIVLEAESWSFHGNPQAFARDIRRYTELTRAGWRVARFTWGEVRDDPDYVRSVLDDLASGRSLRQFS
jgi:very-short-patch-repair endonuclease